MAKIVETKIQGNNDGTYTCTFTSPDYIKKFLKENVEKLKMKLKNQKNRRLLLKYIQMILKLSLKLRNQIKRQKKSGIIYFNYKSIIGILYRFKNR